MHIDKLLEEMKKGNGNGDGDEQGDGDGTKGPIQISKEERKQL